MSAVISDTSVISNLLQIGHLDLLPRIYGEVFVPPSVVAELRRDLSAVEAMGAILGSSWLKFHSPSDQAFVDSLKREVDAGEAEAIALAAELPSSLLLIDEKDGRAIARRLGIRISGLVGTLIRAKSRGLLAAVAPVLDALTTRTTFRVAPSLREDVLRLAGELPDGR